MHPQKKEIAEEVFKFIRGACDRAVAPKETIHPDKNEPIQEILTITPQQAADLINKIIIALPDEIFYLTPPAFIPELIGYIAKEFIFFQSQENLNDGDYPAYFLNFLNGLYKEIRYKYFYSA